MIVGSLSPHCSHLKFFICLLNLLTLPSLSLFAQQRPETSRAPAYFARAEQLSQNAQFDSANYYFEKAAAIYKTAAMKRDDAKIWERLVTCYNRLGENLRMQGQLARAVEYLDMALEVGLSRLGEKSLSVATSYHEIAVVHRTKGDYDKALEYFHKSLQTRLTALGDQHSLVASSYNSLGNVYRAKADYDHALEYYRKALAVSLQIFEEGHPSFAACYSNIGVVYYDKGDYDLALEYFHKSLSIEIQRRGEKHPSIGSDYNNMANVYHDKGDYGKALEYHNRALTVRLQALGEQHSDVAESYFNIARTYLELGDYEKALENHHKALAIEVHEFGEKHFFVAESYAHIGNVYSRQGNYDKALGYYQQAISLQLQTLGERHPEVALTYRQIGKVYEQQNDLHQALEYYQKSIITLAPKFQGGEVRENFELSEVTNEVYLLGSLIVKAEALAKLSRSAKRPEERIKPLESSLSTYALASQLMDKTRSGYRAEGSKLFLAKEFAGMYGAAIRTALQLYDLTKESKYRDEAFFFIEKSKSAVLREALQESQAKRFAGIPDSLLEKEMSLRIDLTHYETEIQREMAADASAMDREKIRKFRDRFFVLNRAYDRLVDQFEKDFPKYFDLKYQTQTVSAAELQNVLDSRTAVVEFSIGDGELFIATMTKETFDIVRAPLDDGFPGSVNMFYHALKTADREDFLQSGVDLYQTLLRPIEKFIARKQRLVIIPDGILHYVPFEALLRSPNKHKWDFRELDYLIRRFEICYQYSATLFVNQLQSPATGARQAASGFIGFAPVFANERKTDDSWLAGVSNYIKSFFYDRTAIADARGYTVLNYSDDEITSIAEMFESKDAMSTRYFDLDASETNFKMNAGGYEYVHVATHGVLNEERPELSGLMFFQPGDSNLADDGILYAAECYNLDLHARLVVLSSCDSGVGVLLEGEGLMALARGFLYSGARNVIHSLWKIDDKHTSRLMIELYENILAGKDTARALREAKLELIENETTAFPTSWSSFVLIGE